MNVSDQVAKLQRMALRGLLRNPDYKSRKVSTLAGHIGATVEETKDLLDEIGATVKSGVEFAKLD